MFFGSRHLNRASQNLHTSSTSSATPSKAPKEPRIPPYIKTGVKVACFIGVGAGFIIFGISLATYMGSMGGTSALVMKSGLIGMAAGITTSGLSVFVIALISASPKRGRAVNQISIATHLRHPDYTPTAPTVRKPVFVGDSFNCDDEEEEVVDDTSSYVSSGDEGYMGIGKPTNTNNSPRNSSARVTVPTMDLGMVTTSSEDASSSDAIGSNRGSNSTQEEEEIQDESHMPPLSSDSDTPVNSLSDGKSQEEEIQDDAQVLFTRKVSKHERRHSLGDEASQKLDPSMLPNRLIPEKNAAFNRTQAMDMPKRKRRNSLDLSALKEGKSSVKQEDVEPLKANSEVKGKLSDSLPHLMPPLSGLPKEDLEEELSEVSSASSGEEANTPELERGLNEVNKLADQLDPEKSLYVSSTFNIPKNDTDLNASAANIDALLAEPDVTQANLTQSLAALVNEDPSAPKSNAEHQLKLDFDSLMAKDPMNLINATELEELDAKLEKLANNISKQANDKDLPNKDDLLAKIKAQRSGIKIYLNVVKESEPMKVLDIEESEEEDLDYANRWDELKIQEPKTPGAREELYANRWDELKIQEPKTPGAREELIDGMLNLQNAILEKDPTHSLASQIADRVQELAEEAALVKKVDTSTTTTTSSSRAPAPKKSKGWGFGLRSWNLFGSKSRESNKESSDSDGKISVSSLSSANLKKDKRPIPSKEEELKEKIAELDDRTLQENYNRRVDAAKVSGYSMTSNEQLYLRLYKAEIEKRKNQPKTSSSPEGLIMDDDSGNFDNSNPLLQTITPSYMNRSMTDSIAATRADPNYAPALPARSASDITRDVNRNVDTTDVSKAAERDIETIVAHQKTFNPDFPNRNESATPVANLDLFAPQEMSGPPPVPMDSTPPEVKPNVFVPLRREKETTPNVAAAHSFEDELTSTIAKRADAKDDYADPLEARRKRKKEEQKLGNPISPALDKFFNNENNEHNKEEQNLDSSYFGTQSMLWEQQQLEREALNEARAPQENSDSLTKVGGYPWDPNEKLETTEYTSAKESYETARTSGTEVDDADNVKDNIEELKNNYNQLSNKNSTLKKGFFTLYPHYKTALDLNEEGAKKKKFKIQNRFVRFCALEEILKEKEFTKMRKNLKKDLIEGNYEKVKSIRDKILVEEVKKAFVAKFPPSTTTAAKKKSSEADISNELLIQRELLARRKVLQSSVADNLPGDEKATES